MQKVIQQEFPLIMKYTRKKKPFFMANENNK